MSKRLTPSEIVAIVNDQRNDREVAIHYGVSQIEIANIRSWQTIWQQRDRA